MGIQKLKEGDFIPNGISYTQTAKSNLTIHIRLNDRRSRLSNRRPFFAYLTRRKCDKEYVPGLTRF